MKELKAQDKEAFDLEVAALKKIKPHPHLVTLLTTFTFQQRYYLLFEWAEGGNLEDLWRVIQQPNIRLDQTWVLWLAEQCQGLAEGLRGIHNTQVSRNEESQDYLTVSNSGDSFPEKNCGRHGDIKPHNVLWFRQGDNDHGHGVLRISDFGLTRFHSNDTTKVSSSGIPVSQTYKAPEYDLLEDLSRPFDIWSLGCLYLEFITWVMLGWEGVQKFGDDRLKEQDYRKKWHTDMFFKIHKQHGSDPHTSTATIKDAVINVSTLDDTLFGE